MHQITINLEPNKTIIETTTGDKSTFGPTDYENIGFHVAGQVALLRAAPVATVQGEEAHE